MIVHRKDLKSITIAGGEVRRRLVTVGREPVVLFYKSHPMLRPRFNRAAWKEFARKHDLGIEVKQEISRINRQLRFSYNCHTLSIGPFLGLEPNTWLEGSSSVFTLRENPVQTLLDAFFEPLTEAPTPSQLSQDLQQNDVVMFCDGAAGELVHSGRVRMHGDQALLLSKLGEHPTAVASLEDLADEYHGQFDSIRLFRCTLGGADASSRAIASNGMLLSVFS